MLHASSDWGPHAKRGGRAAWAGAPLNLGRIELRGIWAFGHHGANPGEQVVAQPFVIDVSLDVDLTRAQRSDDLADTVNYAELHATVKRIVAHERFALLERLGGAVLDALMQDRRIARATITLAKPQLLDGATPAVTVHRER